MGMVRAYQKGELKNASPAVKKAAKSMDKSDAKKYASTKHKGRPEKMNKEIVIKKIRDLIREEIQKLPVNEVKTDLDLVAEEKMTEKLNITG